MEDELLSCCVVKNGKKAIAGSQAGRFGGLGPESRVNGVWLRVYDVWSRVYGVWFKF